MKKWVWIVWETQRRSMVLAKELGCDLYIFDYDGWSRYPKCILKTLSVCVKKRPTILFVQNPSMILAAFAGFLKFFLKFYLVVDRHSSFRVGKQYKIKIDTNYLLKFINKALNSLTIKRADLTIVTNQFLATVVENLGGRPFVLPDKIPVILPTKEFKFKTKQNVLLISSCHYDEPFEQIFKAMELLKQQGVYLYITGNYKRLMDSVYHQRPGNVIFTGFISEEIFVNTLFSADVVMTLTTSDHTMLCGCYEAIAACRPLITSKKNVLIEYFKGVRFVENKANSIREGIEDVLQNREIYHSNIKKLKNDLEKSWKANFSDLVHLLEKNVSA